MALESSALGHKDAQMDKAKVTYALGNTNCVSHALNKIKKFIFEFSQIHYRITVSVHLSIIQKKF